MPLPKTLEIRYIGTKKANIFVKQTNKPKPVLLERNVPIYKLGTIVHFGGMRVGEFPKD